MEPAEHTEGFGVEVSAINTKRSVRKHLGCLLEWPQRERANTVNHQKCGVWTPTPRTKKGEE